MQLVLILETVTELLGDPKFMLCNVEQLREVGSDLPIRLPAGHSAREAYTRRGVLRCLVPSHMGRRWRWRTGWDLPETKRELEGLGVVAGVGAEQRERVGHAAYVRQQERTGGAQLAK